MNIVFLGRTTLVIMVVFALVAFITNSRPFLIAAFGTALVSIALGTYVRRQNRK